MAARLTIGKVAEETGVAATTLRYYEQIGLVPVPGWLGASGVTTTRWWPGSR